MTPSLEDHIDRQADVPAHTPSSPPFETIESDSVSFALVADWVRALFDKEVHWLKMFIKIHLHLNLHLHVTDPYYNNSGISQLHERSV